MKLDLRSLAAYRISIGLVVLIDLIDRSRYLVYHYTDHGVLPRESLIHTLGDGWRLSFHNWNGSISAAWTMMLIAGLASISLTLGWRTRTATVLTWVLNLSLQNRNPLLLSGADVFLRNILLLSIFLPLGARFSFDRLFAQPGKAPDRWVDFRRYDSPGTTAFAVQVFALYFCTGILKFLDPSWASGWGGYYSFYTYQFTTKLGQVVSQFPLFLRTMSWVIPVSEILLPFGLFFPARYWKIRIATVMSFVSLHLGIFLFFSVGIFPWLCIAVWIAFIPAELWDRWVSSFRQVSAFKVYFDGDCGVCQRLALALCRAARLPEAALQAAQSDPKFSRLLSEKNSWIVVTNPETTEQKEWFQFDALVALFSALRWGSGFQKTGNRYYAWFANHRSAWGGLIPRWRDDPSPDANPYRHWAVGLSVLFTVFIVGDNGLKIWPSPQIKNPFECRLSYNLGLDQYWEMFRAPDLEDGWFVMDAVLADGTHVDPLHGFQKPTFDMPDPISSTFRGERERKHMLNLIAPTQDVYRQLMMASHCKIRNVIQNQKPGLEAMELYYMLYLTLPDGKGKAPVKKKRIGTHECFTGALAKWKIAPEPDPYPR